MRIEINERGQQVARFNAELLSISEKVLENVKGTKYRVGTIKFINELGVPKQVTATIYEKNYLNPETQTPRMEVGKSYACEAIATEKGVFTQMSHLATADRAAFEDFGFAIDSDGAAIAGIKTPSEVAAELVNESLKDTAKF